jgi:phosphoadenosine phosphosulfate reductase
MLGQLNMFDKKDKLHMTLNRICEFEPEEGYYLAFSGGKDSQCAYHLMKLAGTKFDSHFNLTTVDPPELIYFIRKNYPDVEVCTPQFTMWQLIVQKLMPPTRLARYCCKELKEKGGSGRMVATGIRGEESYKRSRRRMVENCLQDATRTYFNPIYDWLIGEVWEFLNGMYIPHCVLYDEGQERIGCILCPMASICEKEAHIKRYPTYFRAYLRTFAKMLDERKRRGLKTSESWKTPEDVMRWWVYGAIKGDTDQTIMIE